MEIKKAYKRLALRFHPDKNSVEGTSPFSIEVPKKSLKKSPTPTPRWPMLRKEPITIGSVLRKINLDINSNPNISIGKEHMPTAEGETTNTTNSNRFLGIFLEEWTSRIVNNSRDHNSKDISKRVFLILRQQANANANRGAQQQQQQQQRGGFNFMYIIVIFFIIYVVSPLFKANPHYSMHQTSEYRYTAATDILKVPFYAR